jgi:hypothetical protein
MSNTQQGPSFSKLANDYLRSLGAYREAKAAVSIGQRLGHDTRETEYLAATLQAQHQQAVSDLVSRAVEMREGGRA